jgi:MFS family permease
MINNIKGTAVAIYEVGGMIGALASLYLGDRLGRLRMIFWGHVIIIIGAILQCTAYSLPQFIIARTVTGVGIGFNTVTMYAVRPLSFISTDFVQSDLAIRELQSNQERHVPDDRRRDDYRGRRTFLLA